MKGYKEGNITLILDWDVIMIKHKTSSTFIVLTGMLDTNISDYLAGMLWAYR